MTIDEIYQIIDKTNWSEYETAYGNASGLEQIKKFTLFDKFKHHNEYREYKFRSQKNKYTVNCSEKLKELFSDNENTAVNAAADLSNALCHQRVMIHNAALPAYEILIHKLKTSDIPEIQEELIEMFYGFAICTELNDKTPEWCMEIRKKLVRDKKTFYDFFDSKNGVVSYFSVLIKRSLEGI